MNITLKESFLSPDFLSNYFKAINQQEKILVVVPLRKKFWMDLTFSGQAENTGKIGLTPS